MKKISLTLISVVALLAGLESWGGSHVPNVKLSAEKEEKLVELRMAYIEGSMSKELYDKAKSEIINSDLTQPTR